MNTLVKTLNFFLVITGELTLLFIGISFLIGLLQEYVPPQKMKKVISGSRPYLVNNMLGASFGALTPFCSCSTIPIVVGLLNGGAQFGAIMSFLIASPILNPVILSLMIMLLGINITIIYSIIAFPAAVLIGFIWDKLGLATEVKEVTIQGYLADADSKNLTHTQKITRALVNSWSLFKEMIPWLLCGAGIGSFIYGVIPREFILKIAGPGNPMAIPTAAIIGVPMYIRTATMLPISKVLLTKGMGIGAVMALIIGGAGASIPEVSLLAAIFKKKFVITFIITVFLLATFAGFIFTILT